MKTRKFPLRLAALAVGVVIVGGGIIGLAGSALNPGQLRDDLQDAVRRQTGRELTVAGGVHLRLGLSPQIVLDDVSLANLPGGSRPQMLTARHVTARLALLPLLGGDAVISALTIEQPDLLLERGQDGAPNWRFAPERRALFTARRPSDGNGNGGGHRVEIHRLSLEGGQIAWQPSAGQKVQVDLDHMTLSSDGTDSPMALSLEGSLGGQPVTLRAASGSLQRLQGGPVSAVAGAWPLSVDATVQGATLHVEGGFAHPEQGRGYHLRAKLDAAALGALAPLLPIALPPLSQVTATALLEDGSQGELRTSQVAIHAGQSDLSGWVVGLSVKQAAFTAPGPGQLAQLNVEGGYQDQPLRAAVTAMQPDLVGGGGPIQVTVDAQAAGATLAAHGAVPPGLGAPGLDLQLAFHAPDLSALSPLVGRTLPAAHDAALSAELGDAGVRLRGIAVRNLVASSSLGDVSGQLTLVWSPRVDVNGTLTAHTLNLDGLAPGAADSGLPAIWPLPSGGAPAIPAPIPPSTTPPQARAIEATSPPALPLARLRTTDADLNLSVGDMVFGGRHYGDVQAHLRLQDGKLALNPIRAQTPDGLVTGGLSLDASSDLPPVAVTLRSPSVSAASVAEALGYPGGAAGSMQVDAELSGTGQTLPALQASLDGHLGLAMVDGQVDESLVQGLLGAALNTAGVQSFTGGNAQVRCFALRVDFRHGQGNVRALAADTSRLNLDGSGTIDLGAGTADLRLRPRVRLGPTEIAAPVSLSGPFGQMRAALDPVVGGGRYGLTIGSAPAGPSACGARLALARGGLGGPLPPPADAAPPDAGLVIRKPKDLLQGLFH